MPETCVRLHAHLRSAALLAMVLTLPVVGRSQTATIIDHRHTNLSTIPTEWIEAAKAELHIAYGHTSHGSQLTDGMSGLVDFRGDLYAWNNGGVDGALDLRDTPFSGAEDLGNPNRSAWAQATRTYLNAHPEVNVIIWSWCGQVSGATEAEIDTYLSLMNDLEGDYPNVRFVYMTGHLDGGGLDGSLHLNNERIRAYCRNNGKTLYDFADIESYNPDGVYFGDRLPTDNCDYDSNGDGEQDRNWAIDWQNAHTEGVDWYQCSAAHSQPLNGNLKAYAAWALWARLAGWMGGAGDTIAMASRSLIVREDLPVATLGIVRTGELTAGITVDYRTNDGLGTAIAGEDYVSTSGTLTFAEGETSKTIGVSLIDDTLQDDGETFHVELTAVSGTGAALGVPASTAVTIEDDDTVDAWVQFGAAAFSVAEGGTLATIRVARSGNAARNVTVDYATLPGGTATAGEDYTASAGTLTFASGQLLQTFTIPIAGGCSVETPETVQLELSNPGGAAALGVRAMAVLTIRDDDTAGIIQLASAVTRVGEGAGAATLTVLRQSGQACDVTVDYATSDGTATAGADYTASAGTLSFAEGQTRATIDVPIVQDTLGELDESVRFALSNPSAGARLGALKTAMLTIIEDERVLRFAESATAIGEAGRVALVRVRRSGDMTGSASVDYATADGSARTPEDYAAVSGTLTFGPGVAWGVISVPIVSDTLDEGDETAVLRLHNPVAGVLGAQHTALLTLRDDDAAGAFRFAQPILRVTEAESVLRITVLRRGGTAGPVTVDYSTSGGTATAGPDYDAGGGTLTFAAGQLLGALELQLHGDGETEGTETIGVSLANPSAGATLASPSTATIELADDEPVVELAAASFAVVEGGVAVATVVRMGDLSTPATVDYLTTAGTADPSEDYVSVSGTLSFAPSVARRVITVPTVHDAADESDETITLVLQNAVGTTLGRLGSAELVIRDNDSGGEIAFLRPAFTASEAAGSLTIMLVRAAGLAGGVTVECQVSGQTATPGADYTEPPANPTTLTFRAGQRVQTLTLPILADEDGEGSETIELTLLNPTGGATLGRQATALATIADDDAPVFQLASPAPRVSERSPGATLLVRRLGAATDEATVDFAATAGSATTGADFTEQSGTLTFAPGITTRAFVVLLGNDSLDEEDETVELALSNPSAGSFLGHPQRALLTIVDDDDAGQIELTASSLSAAEGDGAATITLRRVRGAAGEATVRYATSDGGATAGADYEAASGTVSFAEGETTKTVPVGLLQDEQAEPPESVVLSLSDPGGRAVLGSLTTATLWIVDDDTQP